MGGREAWRLTQEGVGRASLSSDTNKLTPVTGQQSVRCCLHPFPAVPLPHLPQLGVTLSSSCSCPTGPIYGLVCVPWAEGDEGRAQFAS